MWQALHEIVEYSKTEETAENVEERRRVMKLLNEPLVAFMKRKSGLCVEYAIYERGNHEYPRPRVYNHRLEPTFPGRIQG